MNRALRGLVNWDVDPGMLASRAEIREVDEGDEGDGSDGLSYVDLSEVGGPGNIDEHDEDWDSDAMTDD